MARARNIKPAFFANEHLADLSPHTRLLFIALWTLADREGRLEDRPKRIKAQVFPYEDVDVDEGLRALHAAGFIRRYTAAGGEFIQVMTFCKHQNPHHREQESQIPAPSESTPSPGPAQGKPEASPRPLPDKARPGPADSLSSDSLSSDSLSSDSLCSETLEDRSSGDDRFSAWWQTYPKKRKKKDAQAIWKRKKLDALADRLIEDTRARITKDRRWQDPQFIPDPTTYLNGERWNDAMEPTMESGNGAGLAPPRRDEDLERWAQQHGFRCAQPGETYQQFRDRLTAAARPGGGAA